MLLEVAAILRLTHWVWVKHICISNLPSLVQIMTCWLFWAKPLSKPVLECWLIVNTLRPRQNGRHFTDDIFKRIFLNENVWILIKISLKFVSEGPINKISALVQIMAWCRPGDKPLSEPMMISLLTHICVTRPQWVNWTLANNFSEILIEIEIFALEQIHWKILSAKWQPIV